MTVHDFTAVDNERFVYRVPGEKEGDDPIEVSLDYQETALSIAQAMPTAIRPTGEFNENGTPKLGMQKALECLMEGNPLPEDIPPLTNIMGSARKALRVPDHCSWTIGVMIFTAFMKEMSERAKVKKDTPDWPGSSASTPDSSPPKTSKGKSPKKSSKKS